MTEPEDLDHGLDALGVLADARRAVDQVVAAAGSQPVSRDDVAESLGVGRTLAAFHLDKLVDAGLIEASFARRTGRGAGVDRLPADAHHQGPRAPQTAHARRDQPA